MSSFRTFLTLLLLAAPALAQVGPGSTLSCATNVTVTPALRGEGFSESTGDITLTCTGGSQLSPGAQIPGVNISIFFNTTVTSRLLPNAGDPSTANVSESLLIIDEPGSGLPGYGPSLPQILCTTPLIGCTAYVGAVAGPTLGTAVSSGITPAPNVYQGIVSGNSITFFGIPVYGIPASAPVGSARVFRITNIRVNAQPLAGGSGSGASPVQAAISISGATQVTLSNPAPNVGYVSNGLTASALNSGFSQSTGQSLAPASILTFAESFGTAFKTRVAARFDTQYAGQINNPGQNNPGMIYNSDSGFVLPGYNTQVAGLADHGTRLKATFNNVTAGVRIFVSTGNVISSTTAVPVPAVIGGSAANLNTPGGYVGYAQLVTTESVSDGDAGVPGNFPAVAPTASAGAVPVAEVAIASGTGTAVWEVVNTNPNTNENFKFGVYITYAANPGQNSPFPGTTSVNLSFAPTAFSANNLGDSTRPVFAGDASAARDLFTIRMNPASLTVSKSHAGNLTQGQTNAVYTITVSNQAGAFATNGTVTVTEQLPAGLSLVSMTGIGWSCFGTSCNRSDSLVPGSSYPAISVLVNVSNGALSPQVNSVSVSGGNSARASASDSAVVIESCVYQLLAGNTAFASPATRGFLGLLDLTHSCNWTASTPASWIHFTSLAAGSGPVNLSYVVDANPTTSPRSSYVSISGQNFTITQNAARAGLRFVPITPCRIADTRFGDAPNLAAATPRNFPIAGICDIPANAEAYSLNLTVVPPGNLGFLSVWPAGQPQPVVSTLNSTDGRIKANAAIVPAGENGAVTLFASHPTNAIIDINGYFVPASGNSDLVFYPLEPCRIVDTRIGTGALAGPAIAGATIRTLPVLSGPCSIPANAQAYALNVTAVPSGPLGFVSVWPAGQGQPNSSTLNAPTGAITANAAIVPAGTNGGISLIATHSTNIVIDINGYFAPPGSSGGLHFYTTTPCRIADTREAAGVYGGPQLAAATRRDFPVAGAVCGIPGNALGFSLNATVVPPAGLGFLSLWGHGIQPTASTLNAGDGSIVANAALVPAFATGTVSAFASHLTHLILDINGYFAQ